MQRFLTLFLPMNNGIALSLWWQLGLLLLSAAAYPFDSRHIMGVNPWLKPIKFELSVAIFLATTGMLLTQVRSVADTGVWQSSAATMVGWTVGIAMIVENTLIALQAMRGVRSHMNYDGLFNTGVFGSMALGVVFNTLALIVLLIIFSSPSMEWRWPPAVVTGAWLGLGILIWGSLEEVAMVTRQQHTVGGPDNGAGLAFLNWSATQGDLRVAHFFAIHAIQILIVSGFLLAKSKLPIFSQRLVMLILAGTYLFACHQLFRQAIAGRPFIRTGTSTILSLKVRADQDEKPLKAHKSSQYRSLQRLR